MKKWMAAAAAAMMIGTFAFTASAVEVSDVTGTWYGSLLGMSLELEMSEDGSYTMTMFGEEEAGTWEIRDDKIVMDAGSEAEGVFSYNEETQTLDGADESSGIEFSFSREPVESFQAAEPVADASEEDFNGIWKSGYVEFMGMTVDGASLGLEVTAEVENGHVVMNCEGLELEDKAFDCEFADGAYSFSILDEGTEGESLETGIRMEMLQDGTMKLAFKALGQDFIFYMEPAEAAEENAAA